MLSAWQVGKPALKLTVLCCYVYFFAEWLFFVTKPSILSLLSPLERVSVLLTSPVPLLLLATGATVILAFSLRLLRRTRLGDGPRLAVVFGVVPAVLMAATLILLVENFSYTMFGFGMISLQGRARHLYLAPIAVIAGFSLRTAAHWLAGSSWLTRRKTTAATALLLAASGIATAIQLQIGAPGGIGIEAPVGGVAKQYPNVLLFCSDGINARRMSAYGYTRPTTPFIEKLAERSLVFENHFTNSAKTTGSVGSLLSGKLPTTTRVVFRPDVFTGIHIYQHLPGILRRYGFRNGDFSVRHYIDAYDLNMREAFHWANGRSLEEEGMLLPRWFRRSLPSAALFAEESYDRVSGRVLHVLGVREMQNPYVAVARPDAHRDSDRQRVDALKQFIRDSPEPFFAHVHLLGTHGPFFSTGERRFSAGQEQTRAWMPDFYDDAILQYDRFTREIVEFLEERGSFERTILVLNTDHGFRWAIDEPLPLIIHFPGEEHTGVRVANSQRIDIAPTLLETLGIPRPDWMSGQSLLSLQPGRLRPILVTNRMPSVEIGGWRQVPSPSPPFYTLGSLNVILCNFIYRLDLRTGRSLRQQIPNHTAPCMPRQLPRSPEVRAFLVDHLKNSGYDVSSLSR